MAGLHAASTAILASYDYSPCLTGPYWAGNFPAWAEAHAVKAPVGHLQHWLVQVGLEVVQCQTYWPLSGTFMELPLCPKAPSKSVSGTWVSGSRCEECIEQVVRWSALHESILVHQNFAWNCYDGVQHWKPHSKASTHRCQGKACPPMADQGRHLPPQRKTSSGCSRHRCWDGWHLHCSPTDWSQWIGLSVASPMVAGAAELCGFLQEFDYWGRASDVSPSHLFHFACCTCRSFVVLGGGCLCLLCLFGSVFCMCSRQLFDLIADVSRWPTMLNRSFGCVKKKGENSFLLVMHPLFHLACGYLSPLCSLELLGSPLLSSFSWMLPLLSLLLSAPPGCHGIQSDLRC